MKASARLKVKEEEKKEEGNAVVVFSPMARKFAQAIRMKLLGDIRKVDKKQADRQADCYRRNPIVGQAGIKDKKGKKKPSAGKDRNPDSSHKSTKDLLHPSNASVSSRWNKRLPTSAKNSKPRSASPDANHDKVSRLSKKAERLDNSVES